MRQCLRYGSVRRDARVRPGGERRRELLHQRRRRRPRHRDEPVRRLRLRAARQGLPVHPRPLLPGHLDRDDQPRPDGAGAARRPAQAPPSAGATSAGAQAADQTGHDLLASTYAEGDAGARALRPDRQEGRAVPSPLGGHRSRRRSSLAGHGQLPRIAGVPCGCGRSADGRTPCGLDDYVRGVVASAEMPSSWSPRGARGPGGRGADIRDHDLRQRRRLQPLLRHPLADVRRRRGRDAVDRRRRRRDPRADRHLQRRARSRRTSSRARAATPRTSRTSGSGATPEPWLRGVSGPLRRRRRQPLSPLDLLDERRPRRARARVAREGRRSSGSRSPSTASRRGS